MDDVPPSFRVDIVVLVVRELGMNEMVEHDAWIREGDRFPVVKFEFEMFGEGRREAYTKSHLCATSKAAQSARRELAPSG